MDEARLKEIKELKTYIQKQMAGKEFKNLSSSDKDKLLEATCKILGLIK